MRPLLSEKDLFVEFLQDVYSAEILQVPALRRFKRRAESGELRDLLHIHASETRMQVLRLEELLEDLRVSLSEQHCRTMASMIQEAEKLVERCGNPELKDQAIIASLMRIKRCEGTVYTMLLEMSKELDLVRDTEILESNAKEDHLFQESLNTLAGKTLVNT